MSTKRPILIVEDDAALRETLAEHLATDGGFTAVGAAMLETHIYRLRQPMETMLGDPSLLLTGAHGFRLNR